MLAVCVGHAAAGSAAMSLHRHLLLLQQAGAVAGSTSSLPSRLLSSTSSSSRARDVYDLSQLHSALKSTRGAARSPTADDGSDRSPGSASPQRSPLSSPPSPACGAPSTPSELSLPPPTATPLSTASTLSPGCADSPSASSASPSPLGSASPSDCSPLARTALRPRIAGAGGASSRRRECANSTAFSSASSSSSSSFPSSPLFSVDAAPSSSLPLLRPLRRKRTSEQCRSDSDHCVEAASDAADSGFDAADDDDGRGDGERERDGAAPLSLPLSPSARRVPQPPRPPRVQLRSLRRSAAASPVAATDGGGGSGDHWQRKRRRRWPFSPPRVSRERFGLSAAYGEERCESRTQPTPSPSPSPSPPPHSSSDDEGREREDADVALPALPLPFRRAAAALLTSPLDRLRRLDPCIPPPPPHPPAVQQQRLRDEWSPPAFAARSIALDAIAAPPDRSSAVPSSLAPLSLGWTNQQLQQQQQQHVLSRLHSFSLQRARTPQEG